MLNAGFTTIDSLKARLLPEAGIEETQWDAALSKLGLAVARRFEQHCNRRFERVTAVSELYAARTLAICLKCCPVEAIASIELRDTDGSLSDAGVSYNLDETSGVIEFLSPPGTLSQKLLVTYDGGYWLDDGTAMPAGATALPDDLLEIWLAEIQLQAEARGLFEAVGLRVQKDSAKAKSPEGLSADTVDGLRGYRRFAGE